MGSVQRKIRGKSWTLAYLLVVFTSVGTTALLAGSSCHNSLHGALLDVSELKRLNKVTDKNALMVDEERGEAEGARVPDHTAILDANLVVALVDLAHLFNTLVERLLSTV